MEFHPKYINNFEIQMKYNNKIIDNTIELKFLGLVLHNTMSWRSHIDMLTHKLNKACYIARTLRPLLSLNSLKIICHAFFNSVIKYGLIFWETSTRSSDMFKLQKRMIKILMEARPRVSCRNIFKTLNILPLASQYILSLALFMVTNKSLFKPSSEMHNFNTRNNSNFFQAMTHSTTFHKSPVYAGINLYNHLPPNIKDLACDTKIFKKSIKKLFA
jgi:hypothetical protein